MLWRVVLRAHQETSRHAGRQAARVRGNAERRITARFTARDSHKIVRANHSKGAHAQGYGEGGGLGAGRGCRQRRSVQGRDGRGASGRNGCRPALPRRRPTAHRQRQAVSPQR